MLKILIRKQIRELAAFLICDKKTGGLRQKRGVIFMALAYLAVLVILGASMSAIAVLLCEMLCPVGADWVYFGFTAVASALIGVVTSVFTTYTMLYGAKDNDTLLSMPIPPRTVLIARMLAVYLSAFVYSLILYLPFTVVYFVCGFGGVVSALLALFSYPFLVLTATALTCLVGWLVALVAPHIRHKSAVSSALAVVAFVAYMLLVPQMETLFGILLTGLDRINALAGTWLLPLSLFGKGASGDVVSFFLSSLLSAGFFALICFVMGRNFLRLVNAGKNAAKTVYREKAAKVRSVEGALFAREVSRFLQTPIYLLNCGLGVLLLLAFGVLALCTGGSLFAELPADAAALIGKLLPGGCFLAIAFCVTMDAVAAPSVSLEGKTYPLLRTLPVSAWKILEAKERLHLAVNLTPSVLCALMCGLAFGFSFLEAILFLFTVAAFNLYAADLALLLGVRFANLEWTNPTIPVKQGTAVGLSLLSGMLSALGGGAVACVISYYAAPLIGLFVAGGLFAVGYCVLHYLLQTSGEKQLASL